MGEDAVPDEIVSAFYFNIVDLLTTDWLYRNDFIPYLFAGLGGHGDLCPDSQV